MNFDYEYDYEYDVRYCYPNSHVLINKLNITDAAQLHIAEREITSLKIANAKINPINGCFDLKHLMDIHQYIFGDIYEWAGKLRWVNIAKGNVFCNYEFIEKNAIQLFDRLKAEKYLADELPETVIEKLSYYLGEINVLHPFREGNGRTQRLFIEYLADKNGYVVDFSNVTDKEMIEASAFAFACNYQKMNELFKKITSKQYIS